MPRVIVEKGPDKGKSFTLTVGQNVIVGRDTAVPIAINDPMASRRHLVIGERRGQWLIKDLESANGTIVNGRPLESGKVARIGDGETFQIGDSLFSFTIGSDLKDDPLIGTEIGGYRVDSRLGRGAMGTVYQAHQLSLGREVALKVLAHDLVEDEKFTSMFVKEARAAAALNHPNILQVYDVGEANGQFFMSMEIAEGGSVLEELRAAGEIELDRSIEIIRDSLAALQYAERKGIVHRDIKPDNLMIGADSVVKLGDLGLAAPTAELQVTQTGVFGTPHYIAPEQAMGKPVDHRADIYALGATWYRILSGRTLFTGVDVREILKRQVREQHKPLTEVTPGIPQAISDIVDRMLKKSPDERYQGASEVLHDIDNYLLNRNASKEALAIGRSPKTLLMGGADGKPNLPMLIGAGVLLLAIIGAALWFFVLSGDEKEAPAPAPVVKDNPKPVDNGPQVDPREIAAQTLYKQALELKTEGKLPEWERQLGLVVRDYADTPTGVKAKAELAQLTRAREEAKLALATLKDTLSQQADQILANAMSQVKTYKVEAISRAWPDFRAEYEDNAEAQAIIDELPQGPQLSQLVLQANRAYSEALEAAEARARDAEKFGDTEIDKAIAVLDEAVSMAVKARDLTDSQDNKTRADTKIADYKRYREDLITYKLELESRERSDAASQTTTALEQGFASISATVRQGDLDNASKLLDILLTNDEGWQAHSESSEYRDVRVLVSDRKSQTKLIVDARRWLAQHWETDFISLTDAPADPQDALERQAILSLLPKAKTFKLRQILTDRDGDASKEFVFRTTDDANRPVDGSLAWQKVPATSWPALLAFALRHSSNLKTDLSAEANESVRMGLGLMMLEMCVPENQYASAGLAYSMIQPIYRRHEADLRGKQPNELADDLRRIKEAMAYAILAESMNAFELNDLAKARSYLEELDSNDFRETRAAKRR